MAFYDKFPYTNFQELNLDRIIQELIKVKEGLNFVIENASLKYADPIQWNITHQYAANTVVIDPETGIAYISTKPVPNNILITNTEYWTPIFDLSALFDDVESDIANLETELNTTNTNVSANTAAIETNADNISANTAAINDEVTNRENADTAINTTIGTLWKANIKLYGAVGDGVTDDSQAFIDAIAANGSVYFPHGKYNLNNTQITLKPNTTITGENAQIYNAQLVATGNRIHITNLSFQDCTANYVVSVSTGTTLLIDGCEFKNVRGGIDVENVQHTVITNTLFWNFTGYAVYLHNINDVVLSNLFINGNNNSASVGIRTTSKNEAIMVDNVEIIQCYRAALFDSIAYSMINSLYCDSSLGDALTLNNASDIQLVNCWLSNRATDKSGLVCNNASNITIKGLTAHNNGGLAQIVLFNTGCNGITLTDSVFCHNATNIVAVVMVDNTNVKINGCTFDGSVTPTRIAGTLSRSIITNNISSNAMTLPTTDSTHINANNIIG